MLNDFEKGVWYWSSVQMSDHHDFAGFPNKFYFIQTLLGFEFRTQFWINTLNRVKMLEFENTHTKYKRV